MYQIVGMEEAKSKLAELVGQAKYGGKRFLLQRRGRPMAVLVGVEEFEQIEAQASAAKADHPSPLPPDLRRRQEALIARAIRLRERFGAPEDRLAELFADLPSEDDSFWAEVEELR